MLITCRVLPNGTIRTATHQGRPQLVVPVIALVAGVVNQHLAPAEAIADSVPSWNGVPLMVGHPQNSDGQPISANASPDVAAQAVGRFWQTTFADERLGGELWLDLGRAAAQPGPARTAVERLQAGQPLEVSTAFFAKTQAEPGTYQGRDYVGVYSHIRPDHLALLPDAVGACSWEDGCGAPRVHTTGGTMHLTDQRLTTLVQHCQCEDTEANRALLAALPEAWLTALTTEGEPQPVPVPDDEDEPEPEPEPTTVPEALARIPGPLRDTFASIYAEHEAQKAALIQTLVTHKCPMPKAHLQTQTLETLRQYHTMMQLDTPAPSYLGQGLHAAPDPLHDVTMWAPLSILARKET